jgi:hypothetical protein
VLSGSAETARVSGAVAAVIVRNSIGERYPSAECGRGSEVSLTRVADDHGPDIAQHPDEIHSHHRLVLHDKETTPLERGLLLVLGRNPARCVRTCPMMPAGM